MFNSSWFDNLIKPPLNPPGWIFSPVWIILYATLLISLIIYTIKVTGKSKLGGYIFFVIQLVLNLAWSPIFFSMHNIGLALVVVILMDIFAILTAVKFFAISKISGILLIPYIVWILFATYLNASFFVLN